MESISHVQYEKNAMPINAFIMDNLRSNKKAYLSELISDLKNEMINKIKASNIKRIYIYVLLLYS